MSEILKTPRLKAAVKMGLGTLALMYLVAIFAEFIAPYDYREQTRQEPSAPASEVRFVDSNGTFHVRPFIYRSRLTDAREMAYDEDTTREWPLSFFVDGSSYNLLGIVPTDVHLFGIAANGETAPRLRLLGTDQLGRDRFSRLVIATRFSLLVSPAGTLLACMLGIAFGAISGYAGRFVDAAMMSIADTVIALPTLILILAARAAFPLELPPMTAAILLISIFALTGWAEMARLARGQVVAVRNLEFVTAARALGAREGRILLKHVLPNIAGPLIVQATLILPAFFLAEVALSFLGVGLQEPEPSLGNMLTSASDLTQLSHHPLTLLSPALVIFLFVLATRLLSRGRRSSIAA
ncbi:MAG TPA: ABC transporter permease [Pyrinomonadaceae bacterium]|jgi:peptide/nickel transport system permease protein|nr:ABC transporter permease [Pyrinomonadaceae bacterium]